MEMKKNSTTTSMKALWIVLGLMLLIVTAQFGQADCRALRSTTMNSGNAGCQQVGDGEVVGMASFAVSSNNSSSDRPLARSLAFRLASGPSKRGPGH
ncbi:uncharacterized protein LOC132803728 [Ziziphus jujuba]|uniref:Uncharacterized protein LOC132803728 n=2 Tax=Ziziphus jujuba TaxID=326968 RepID=A0ABM4A8T9_ZIZJJ|nr:uncharacterized protein LOC132803728 [Ziziphus jujuba]KAH7523687.1 hypothetical protein FEM48_Zijuj06G0038300 [Ziziphus jujuba var. spinosa]